MPTPKEIIAANARRVLAQHATPGLAVSTDSGSTWTDLDGVLLAERSTETVYEPDVDAETQEHGATLKVADTVVQLADGTWVRETAADPAVTWAVMGRPSIHPGKRLYRLGRLTHADDGGGPDRQET